MAFQIQQMSFDLKQGTGTVSLQRPPTAPSIFSTSVNVFFPFKPQPAGKEPEQEIERQIRAEA